MSEEEKDKTIQEAVKSIEFNLKEIKQGWKKYRYSLSDYISGKLKNIRIAVDILRKYY